jgi:hypothetical protein
MWFIPNVDISWDKACLLPDLSSKFETKLRKEVKGGSLCSEPVLPAMMWEAAEVLVGLTPGGVEFLELVAIFADMMD